MGSRTRDTMNEIDQIRASLDATLAELEQRLPGIAWSKRALQLAVGGGGTSVALLAARRMTRSRSRKRKDDHPVPQVTVKVFTAGAGLAALGVAAVWAGVRLAEAKMRTSGERRADLRPLPSRARGAS